MAENKHPDPHQYATKNEYGVSQITDYDAYYKAIRADRTRSDGEYFLDLLQLHKKEDDIPPAAFFATETDSALVKLKNALMISWGLGTAAGTTAAWWNDVNKTRNLTFRKGATFWWNQFKFPFFFFGLVGTAWSGTSYLLQEITHETHHVLPAIAGGVMYGALLKNPKNSRIASMVGASIVFSGISYYWDREYGPSWRLIRNVNKVYDINSDIDRTPVFENPPPLPDEDKRTILGYYFDSIIKDSAPQKK